jgi:sulfate permease, SulP family
MTAEIFMSFRFPARYTPKSVICLQEGYTRSILTSDLMAGLTVAVIALPLAMALGIASIPQDVADQLRAIHPWLTPPAMGLFTSVVAGFLISMFGGSRVQIGGPTAAFIPIVFGVASMYGYEGLVLATIMAGCIVILMGLFRFGTLIKFIPYPVTTGFTSGIGVMIFTGQIKDFLGLSILNEQGTAATVPADFVPKVQMISAHITTINWYSAGVGIGSLAILILLRKLLPKVPGAIVAVIFATALVWIMGWASTTVLFDGVHSRPLVETIGTRFGGIPNGLHGPHMPEISFALIRQLIPAATTIALLCCIESLLSAVVADGMTGNRHHSDQELVGQGIANIASGLFFGLPATGAIARTAANVKSGGKTPLAGMIHAVVILGFMLLLAPLAKEIPLPTLAAILMMVAWNIAEVDHFRALLRAPRSDILVLLTTFGLTVFTDLTIGVGVGMVLASFLFMKRMSEMTTMSGLNAELIAGQRPEIIDPKDPAKLAGLEIPDGVEIYEVNGPFFFGVADKLMDTLSELERPPSVFILRLRAVPHIDATGLHALEEFVNKCKRQGTALLLGGVHAQPMFEMTKVGLLEQIGVENMFEDVEEALDRATELLGDQIHVHGH